MKSLAEEHTIIYTNHLISKPLVKYQYEITVEIQKDESFNINISHPTFYTSAFCDAEAIGRMMMSDFAYKHEPIYHISKY